ncbi:MAG: polysaccharide biosynthesis C-terminal domain-containing protein [Prevotella sp.]|nr:polysaccharide biosynthesis C-terminal domain-containing protein [Prevotella sp.]
MAGQNHRRNAFWGLVSAIVDIFCGLYTSRLLLNAYGATAHGLVNTINNFLGLVLTIILSFHLIGKNNYYAPLITNDIKRLAEIYRRSKRANRRANLLMLGATMALAFIFPCFYLQQFTYWDTALLVLGLGLFLCVRTSTNADTQFLTADYRSYLVKIINICTTLLTTLLYYGLVYWGASLQTVKISVALALLFHPLFYGIYRHTHYRIPKPTAKVSLYPVRPIMIVRRISEAFLGRIDVLILTIAATLTDVSIYAVYYMATKYLTACINALFSGHEAVYGHAFAQKDPKAVIDTHAKTHFYLANLLGIGFAVGIVMLNPFVALYTKWVKGVNYNQFWFGFTLLIAQMLTCISAAQKQLIYAKGNVHHGRILCDGIIEAAINLVLSLALIPVLGLTGVAVGTVIALAYRVVRQMIYRQKYVLRRSLWKVLRRYLPTVIMLSIALYIALNFMPHPNNKFAWVFASLKIGLVFVPLDIVLNFIFNYKQTKWISAYLCRQLKGKIRNCCHDMNKKICCVYKHLKTGTYYIYHRLNQGIQRVYRGLIGKIRHSFIFAWRALGGIYQRGLVRAVRTYFAHQRARAFEAAHPDMDDLPYLTAIGEIYLGVSMNLTDPQTLNEKINWLKINYHRQQITMMSDKVAAKNYVAKKLGTEYVIPTYGVWDSFDAIDWDSLPRAFVLKCTHDSGSIYVVKDKNKMDKYRVKRHIEHYLDAPYWRKLREWGYRYVKPQIIAEEYLPSIGGRHSTEYKFTCFNGQVVFGTVCSGFPHGFHKRRVNDFYDRDFQHLPWRAWYRNARRRPKRPVQWETMVAISEKFAQGLPYLRVDLYLVDDQIYFGEFTFYTGGGFIEFHPRKMDLILGQMLTLPTPKKVDKTPAKMLALPTTTSSTNRNSDVTTEEDNDDEPSDLD